MLRFPKNKTTKKATISDNEPIFVVLTDADGTPQTDEEGNPITICGKDPNDCQGITFRVPQHDGTTLRARITGTVSPHGQSKKDDRTRSAKKQLDDFKCKYDTTDVEDTIAYNDVMNYLHRDKTEDGGIAWHYRRILGHEGPLDHRHHNYKRSKYNILIEWENGETTSEPYDMIFKDDPITLAKYAKDNNLLDTPGWK